MEEDQGEEEEEEEEAGAKASATRAASKTSGSTKSTRAKPGLTLGQVPSVSTLSLGTASVPDNTNRGGGGATQVLYNLLSPKAQVISLEYSDSDSDAATDDVASLVTRSTVAVPPRHPAVSTPTRADQQQARVPGGSPVTQASVQGVVAVGSVPVSGPTTPTVAGTTTTIPTPGVHDGTHVATAVVAGSGASAAATLRAQVVEVGDTAAVSNTDAAAAPPPHHAAASPTTSVTSLPPTAGGSAAQVSSHHRGPRRTSVLGLPEASHFQYATREDLPALPHSVIQPTLRKLVLPKLLGSQLATLLCVDVSQRFVPLMLSHCMFRWVGRRALCVDRARQ